MLIWEIVLLALALSMDACAVAMTNGMCDAKMSWKRALLIGLFFGVFQMMMPVIGYYVAGVVADVFLTTFEKRRLMSSTASTLKKPQTLKSQKFDI